MPYCSVNGVNLYFEWHGPAEGEALVLNNGIFASTAGWARPR